jgi:hypothetical protein
MLPPIACDLSSQFSNTPMQCQICTYTLSHHLRHHRTYWFCNHCRTEWPEPVIQRGLSSSNRCLRPVLPQGQSEQERRERGSGKILCIYDNLSSASRVVRITNLPGQHFERTVMPHQRFIFETVPEALLEIWGGGSMGCLIEDRIACDRLAVSNQRGGRSIVKQALPMAPKG